MQLGLVHQLVRGGVFLLTVLLVVSCDAGGQMAGTPASETSSRVPGASTSPTVAAPVSLKESPFTGYLAPNFTLTGMDGQKVTLHDLRGHPVWINLWATWCVPCKSEMPAMQKLYNRFKTAGLVILGVNAQEARSTVATYVQQGGYSWTFLLDPDSAVRSKYLFVGVPSHVFIDKAGVIRAISIGELDATGMSAYLARIIEPGPLR